MSSEVKLSRGTLALLFGALAASLLTVGFLLGRVDQRSPVVRETVGVSPPLAVAQPTVEPADRTLDARLDAIDKRLEDVKRREGGTLQVGDPVWTASRDVVASPSLSARSTNTAAIRSYIESVDSILGGEAAIASSRPMAARLVEQALGGSDSQFDLVVKRTSEARASLLKVPVPEECAEHHRLVSAQLTSAVALLREVRVALTSGDTRKLATLTTSAGEPEADVRRLQSLDHALRRHLEGTPR